MFYFLDLLQWFLIFAILIGSTGFFVGETGLPFIGHVGFFAIGAYSSAVAACKFHVSPLAGVLLGLLLTVLVAAPLSLLLLRLTGHLLLIASLGFCEIIRAIADCSTITNGGTGLTLPASATGSSGRLNSSIMVLSLAVLILQLMVHRRLLRSRAGKFLHCLREDAELFHAGGRSPFFYSGGALLFTAITASLAGSLYAHYSHYVDPTSFTIVQALQILLALMIGGLGSQRGSVAAAAVLVIVPGLLRFVNVPVVIAGAIDQIFFGLLVIILTRCFPRGVFGTYLLP